MTAEAITDRPVDLLDRGQQLLATAQRATSGRAAANLMPGPDPTLTQTVLALIANSVLADHVAPGPATLLVLVGRAVVTTSGGSCQLDEGQWSVLPSQRHGLRAVTDMVALLTIGHRAAALPDRRRAS